MNLNSVKLPMHIQWQPCIIGMGFAVIGYRTTCIQRDMDTYEVWDKETMPEPIYMGVAAFIEFIN